MEKTKIPVTVTNAIYRDSKVDAYQNNPLILALPPLLEPSRFKAAMSIKVPSPEYENKSDSDRIEDIKSFRKTCIVTTQHLDLYNEIYEILSHGYVNRNPSRPEVVAWSYDIADSAIPIGDIKRPYSDYLDQETTAAAAFITGFSGNGKTKITEGILIKCFPMVIEHHWNDFSEPQIVFVKVDMPHNGNRTALIYKILAELDRILPHTSFGKTFYAKKCKTKSGNYINISQMEDILFTALNRHHVGLLIIDEYQNLQVTSSRFRNEMLQLMATLCNQLDVPNIKIGTPDTILLFDSKGSNKRRTGVTHELSRFDAKDWDRAMKVIFSFQPIFKPVEPSEPMIKLLMDLTAGVPSIFMTIWESILTEAIRSGTEKITLALIKRVFRKRFPMLRSVTRNINQGIKGRHVELLTVQQYLDSGNKALALKHLQHFSEGGVVKGAAASAVIKDINALVEQEVFSDSDLKKFDKIRKELESKSGSEKSPQTLEHES